MTFPEKYRTLNISNMTFPETNIYHSTLKMAQPGRCTSTWSGQRPGARSLSLEVVIGKSWESSDIKGRYEEII